MAKSKGADGGLLGAVGDIAVRALLKPRQETRMTLLTDASPSPPRALRAGEEYIRVQLLSANLPYTRKFLTSYEPLVYAGVGLGEIEGDPAEFAKVISDGHKSDGIVGADRATVSELTLLEASPYAGSLNLALGLLSVRSSERSRKMLDELGELSSVAATPLIGVAGKAVGALSRAVNLLTMDGSYVEVGVMTTKQQPTTGIYALYSDRGAADMDVKFGFVNGKLINHRDKDRPVNRPYIVILIEALDRRSDAAKIPRIKKSLERVLEMIDAGGVTEQAIAGLMQDYVTSVRFSPDLLQVDKDHLIESAKQTFDRFRKDRAQFDIDSKLENAGVVLKPPKPTVEDVVADAMELRFSNAPAPPSMTVTRQPKLPDAARALRKAAKEGDLAHVGGHVRACLDAIQSDPRPVDPGTVRDVMLCLRALRRFDDLKKVGEALDQAGIKMPVLMGLHAQALIELKQATVAEGLLKEAEELARKHRDDTARADIFGQLGRIQKDRFVALTGPKDKRARQDALDRAITFYRRGEHISNDPSNFYHAVNWMALTQAGKNAGLNAADTGKVKKLAKRILSLVNSKWPNAQMWDAANAAEASLALGDMPGAEMWLERYVDKAYQDGFALNSTLRQITTLWGITPGAKNGRIVEALQLAAISADNGASSIKVGNAKQLLQSSSDKSRFEAVFEGPAGTSVQAAYKALGMSRFVGMVRHGDKPHGTGFLVRARDLLPGGEEARAAKLALLQRKGLGDGWLFLTNAHVIEPTGAGIAITPDEAVVEFQMASDKKFRVKQVVTSWPSSEHDCTIMELDGYPTFADDAAPVIAANLPRCKLDPADAEGKKNRPRVLVLGHPAGRELEITFDNNLLIDHNGPEPGSPFNPNPVQVHYRAPTEGGSSGSPVFNARTLELIAIHHKGGVSPIHSDVPAQGYEANQGMALRAITYAFDAYLRSDAKPAAVATAAPAPPAPAPAAQVNGQESYGGIVDRIGEEAFEAMRGAGEWEDGEVFESAGRKSQRRLPQRCADLIAGFEISSPAYYRKRLQAPCWPGGASGLTIGVGYDLRHNSETELRTHWAALAKETLDRLAPYCKKSEPDLAKRKAAKDSLKDIVIPLEIALQVYAGEMIPVYTARTEAAFANTGELNDISMGALVSLVFNRGGGLGSDDTRKEMRNIAAHMKAKAFDKIPAEMRAMKRLWEGKKDMAGVLLRRDAEAAFFEDGLNLQPKPPTGPGGAAAVA